MYMAKAKVLRLVRNLYSTRVGGFALGDAKVPNANGFASQWNIDYNQYLHNVKRNQAISYGKRERLTPMKPTI